MICFRGLKNPPTGEGKSLISFSVAYSQGAVVTCICCCCCLMLLLPFFGSLAPRPTPGDAWCQLFRMRFRIGWKQQPAVPVPTWFATIHVARQPQIAYLSFIYLYIHSLLSLIYIN